MGRRGYTLGDLSRDRAKERQREGRPRASESTAERIARLERGGAFQLEPTEALSRGAQRYAASKTRKHVRRVRSPRLSDEEFRRVELQARRLLSEEPRRRGGQEMTPLEFIREAAMAVTRLLEEMPEGDAPPPIWELLRSLVPAARNAPVAGNARNARAAAGRAPPAPRSSQSALERKPATAALEADKPTSTECGARYPANRREFCRRPGAHEGTHDNDRPGLPASRRLFWNDPVTPQKEVA